MENIIDGDTILISSNGESKEFDLCGIKATDSERSKTFLDIVLQQGDGSIVLSGKEAFVVLRLGSYKGQKLPINEQMVLAGAAYQKNEDCPNQGFLA